MGMTTWAAIGDMAMAAADEVSGWFGGGGEGTGVAAAGFQSPVDASTLSSTASDAWVADALKVAMPQIMQLTGKRGGGSPRATGSASSAKPVGGNAASAMEVPKMIGKAASNNPLSDIQGWGNLF